MMAICNHSLFMYALPPTTQLAQISIHEVMTINTPNISHRQKKLGRASFLFLHSPYSSDLET